MSFNAVISNDSHKQVWARSISCLSQISENVKFTISASSIVISAVNSTSTTHGEVSFQRSFFYDYAMDTTDIMQEGYSGAGDDWQYSFVVNSNHLSILFRAIDTTEVSYISFRIFCSTNTPSSLRFKLLFEIKSKKLIVKKYRASYLPVREFKQIIPRLYKQQLRRQRNGEPPAGDKVKFIAIEQNIPKQFLDMISTSIEDFRVEIKGTKVLLSGYTNQVVKDKEYLKQPMSVTITIGTEEFLKNNISEIDNDTSINFRLKDFKLFMSLISYISTTDESKHRGRDVPGVKADDFFELYFKNPGDPIFLSFCAWNMF